MAGRGAAGPEAFFSVLPDSRLTANEVALRQALLDIAQEVWPKPFPLTEWIERRIGGEVEVRRNDAGQDELLPRGELAEEIAPEAAAAAVAAEPPPDRDAFLTGLSPDNFSPEEEALRDAVFEFLALWRSKELATLADLCANVGVQRHAASFLPPTVPLKDWIERRIGGEVEFQAAAGGQEVVHLNPEARHFVTAKYEQLAGAPGARGGTWQRPASPAPAAPGRAPGARGGAPAVPARDAFFAALPANELTPGEQALRLALLERIDGRPGSGGARPGTPGRARPLLAELSQDVGVQRCRAFIPPTVPLREWIDRRIGGEVELHKDERGQLELRRRGAAPGAAAPAAGAASARTRSSAAQEREETGERRINSMESAEEFIGKLPVDRLTDAEGELRQAILDYLEGRPGTAQLSEMCKDTRVTECRSALLPPEVPLRVWIDRRIGAEVEALKDEVGRFVVRLRGPGAARGGAPAAAAASTAAQVQALGMTAAEREALKEEFFGALPTDGFTPDEEELRQAVLDFLTGWKGREPPGLSHVASDARVRKLRSKVLPKEITATLRDWIERRIGGEVELTEMGPGQWSLGFRGRKRVGGGDAGGGPPRKRGGGAGAAAR